MYRWMRNTHLLLGLGFSLFLLMYALSALQMAHPAWFDLKPTLTRERIGLDASGAGSARAVADKLLREHGLRGDVTEVKATAAAFRFRVVRPGENVLVDYSRETGVANLERNALGFMAFINRFHQSAGVRHSYLWLNVWGVLSAIVSVALILISLTGIYLWFKLQEERLTGAILMALSVTLGLTLIVLLRSA
jgi:hypothetical protein